MFSVGTKYHFIFSVNSSCFIDNQYLILLSLLSISNDFDNYPSKVTMNVYDTTMRNNLATSVLVLVEGVRHFLLIPEIAIVLKDLLVDGNIVTNTQWTYAISTGDLESSMLRLLTVAKILIEDSSFLNNQGTPLIVKKSDGIVFSVKKEIHFTNNTGVLGGACGLHNIHLTIQASTEGKIIFEGNTGVYGGALYLNKAIISDRKCKLKVKFINNTATKSGNSVYFATMPQGVIPKCFTHNATQHANISAPAFNMNIDRKENVSQLIPGQNIYIDISVVDYYGSPSSCTADVYITCDNSTFLCSHKQIRLNGPDYVVLT